MGYFIKNTLNIKWLSMKNISTESIMSWMALVRDAYTQTLVRVDLNHLERLINEMQAVSQSKLSEDKKITALISLIEGAFHNERVKYCNGYTFGINTHTDKQFTHYINICENNHYPRLLGLVLKSLYEQEHISPDQKLQKIVSGIDPIFYDVYQLNELTTHKPGLQI